MPDNVILASGALTVATKGDADNVQHQSVVGEYMSGGKVPLAVGVGSPMPTQNDTQIELLAAILVELRIENELMYALTNTETEPLELLRAKYQSWPATP